ncbi:hypothetical protein ESCO_004756 [Escovopsis weberi]|uniref:Serine-threonine protein kinase 19 n=1 Tax=Escovopsis weberi TaxID=150374 RepID=A0A0N0RSV9_ESCWE|nr:hypothetical protein ESCO_004756 [Escovopsis weberi]
MPKSRSLRAVLGTSHRVRKQSALTPRKPRAKRPLPDGHHHDGDGNDDDDYMDAGNAAQLPDLGPVARLEGELLSDLSLRDVPQAMRCIRARMFSPLPATGLHSSRVARTLAARRAIPPLVSPGHLAAVLGDPSAVEREVAQLWAAGALRRVRVPRRGGTGEALIEGGDLAALVRGATGVGAGAGAGARSGRNSAEALSEGARAGFEAFLRARPTARTFPHGGVEGSGEMMGRREVDELVRAGFLASEAALWHGDRLLQRPEDRTTLTSVERVSRHASGTVSAVGGRNAVHLAGGGGGGGGGLISSSSTSSARVPASVPASSPSSPSAAAPPDGGAEALRIAVPGHGLYMKLAEGTAQWLRDLLATRPWAEGTEAWARERFEGGGLYGTRWKEFWGVEWEWVLGQAVGLGVVEVFDTGSVGRGIRGLT